MANIPSDWIKNLKTQEEKNNFIQYLNNSGKLLLRLIELIKEKETTLDVNELSVNDFSDANWSHKQAFRNGKRSALKEIKDLIKFIEG